MALPTGAMKAGSVEWALYMRDMCREMSEEMAGETTSSSTGEIGQKLLKTLKNTFPRSGERDSHIPLIKEMFDSQRPLEARVDDIRVILERVIGDVYSEELWRKFLDEVYSVIGHDAYAVSSADFILTHAVHDLLCEVERPSHFSREQLLSHRIHLLRILLYSKFLFSNDALKAALGSILQEENCGEFLESLFIFKPQFGPIWMKPEGTAPVLKDIIGTAGDNLLLRPHLRNAITEETLEWCRAILKSAYDEKREARAIYVAHLYLNALRLAVIKSSTLGEIDELMHELMVNPREKGCDLLRLMKELITPERAEEGIELDLLELKALASKRLAGFVQYVKVFRAAIQVDPREKELTKMIEAL